MIIGYDTAILKEKKLLGKRIDLVDNTNIDQKLFNNTFFNKNAWGPVVQFGMNAAFARRRSRVQIPPGPQFFKFNSVQHECIVSFNS